jgi:S1-C subfamily serine protease
MVLSAILAALLLIQSPTTIHNVEESVVIVGWNTIDAGGMPTGLRCSGFVVGIAYVITAGHCKPPANTDIYVDGKPSRVVKQSDEFILLSIEPSSKPVLQIRKSRLIIGEPAVSIGFAYGGPIQAFRRNASQYCGCGYSDSDHLVLDGIIAPGMSGGPVVDEDGKVVGLNQADIDGILAVACTSEEIKDFIDGK